VDRSSESSPSPQRLCPDFLPPVIDPAGRPDRHLAWLHAIGNASIRFTTGSGPSPAECSGRVASRRWGISNQTGTGPRPTLQSIYWILLTVFQKIPNNFNYKQINLRTTCPIKTCSKLLGITFAFVFITAVGK